MEHFNYIIFFIIALFEIYILDEFGSNLIGKNIFSRKIMFMVYVIFTFLLFCVNNIGNTTINLLSVPIIFVVFSIIMFQSSLIKRILTAFCFYMITIGPEFMFGMINQLNQNEEYRPGKMSGINTYIMLFIMKLLTYILVKCICHINKSKTYSKVENGFFLKLLILPMATFFLFLSIFYADIKVSGTSTVILALGVALLLLSNVYVFYIFNKLIYANEEIQKMKLLYMKSNIERKNYLNLENINNKHKVILHDLNKYLRTAGELIKRDKTEEVYSLFVKMGVKLQETEVTHFAVNSLLNAILTERKIQADNWNITYDVVAEPDIIVEFIDELDLISILGNLIDNALEAARQVEDNRYTAVRIFMSNHGSFLSMEIENSFFEISMAKNNKLISTKRNKEEHGIGISTVERLVKKYNGMIGTKIDKNIFKVSIAIPLNS